MVSFTMPTKESFISLLIPITYLGILIGSMATFSYLYRRRQHQAKMALAPYFPPHTARDVYLSLLHIPDTQPHGKDDKPAKVPDSILRTALLSRAVTDVQRVLHIRARKPALSTLLQRGVVGDEIYQRLLRAEQELEAEIQDVVAEAKALATGWEATIFQSASEMVQNMILKEKLAKQREGIEKEKKAWSETKEKTRMELMGETVEEEKTTEVVDKRSGLPTPPPGAGDVDEKAPAAPAKTTSSDEEGVLVDTPVEGAGADGPVVSSSQGGGGGGGGGGKKKKKGKK